ncbi:unnamed protein product, partial [Meganyctiphanes norvegica]
MSKGGLFSYTNLVHAVSGGCGSAVAMTALYPLDTVRTRLQLEDSQRKKGIAAMLQEIYNNEGLQGLYRGWAPVIESLYCSNFIYFYTFHGLKRVANTEGSIIKDLLMAMVAGSINVLTTTPLWVVNTRMKMQGAKVEGHQTLQHRKYKGLVDGLFRIGHSEGIGGLWSGTLSSLILVINPAIQFMAYEDSAALGMDAFSVWYLRRVTLCPSCATTHSTGTVLLGNIRVTQFKRQYRTIAVYRCLPQERGFSAWDAYRNFGFAGLFKGLHAKILQTVLTAALMFVAYEKIAAVVFAVLMGRKSRLKN